ncbi:MAG TPA: MGMT family protein [Saprospiraceae bacterium]|nr:MGMT family protein [Saprospiraceae bacterium]
MAKTPHYYEQVYEVTTLIPFGRVTTYGAIADYLALGSARMVGYALRNSFSGMNIPAHRVVNHKGELSGRKAFPTPTLMEELLQAEGVLIQDNKVMDFKQLFWHPAELEKEV